ncbi:MAG: hypothetical protein DSM106950_10375 [Stigonema ocellatum SAG 48.90 = DSM 106950]|nr:hypothetical protein [Stigonema ocellatum SAG 48.90 = DSM 106950]
MINLLDKKTIAEVVNQILSFEKEQINLKNQLDNLKFEFEKLFEHTSLSAKANDDIRDIQCIIDEAKRIDLSVDLSLHKKIKLIIEKAKKTISKTEEVKKKYEESIPNEIFDDLKQILKSSSDNLSKLDDLLSFIKVSTEKLQLVKLNLQVDSKKDTYRIWAEGVETFAEGIEELIKLCPDLPLGILEDLARNLLAVTERTNYSINKKESLRRRIRYTATFILNLVKKTRLNSLSKSSAEKKALERIENDEEIDWVTNITLDDGINIEEISNFF